MRCLTLCRVKEWQPNADERISYDPSTGAGYMDILLDLPNYIIGKETYEITLMAAEDFSGRTLFVER